MKRFLSLVSAMVMVAGLSGAAIITTYNGSAGQTQGDWQTAVGSWTTFQFTQNLNSTPPGTTVTINPVIPGPNGYSGFTVDDKFKDVLYSGPLPNANVFGITSVSSTTYSWSGGPMLAIGGLWDTSPVGEGSGIILTVNLVSGLGSQTVTTLINKNGFFGFISDTAFTSFTLTTPETLFDNFNRPYGIEHYTLDNLQVSTVPEPATLSMVGLALLGLGAFRRYRRK